MKKIGLIGGMSWESTVTYYQVINTVVKKRRGGLHSAQCILYSVDFQEVEDCQSSGDWDKSAGILADAAQNLEKAGADCLVICSNTMHKVYDKVQAKVSIPILHIAALTADALKEAGIKKVGLTGTIYTMEQDFYKEKLMEAGLTVVLPEKQDRLRLNSIIFEELCLGKVVASSQKELLRMVEDLRSADAEAVILGCTELGLAVTQQDTTTRLFDTTLLHAEKAALYALE